MLSGPYKHYINSLLQLFAYARYLQFPNYYVSFTLFISLNPPTTSGLVLLTMVILQIKETKPQRTKAEF